MRLPHDRVAEVTVVGGIMVHSKAMTEVAEHLTPEDFHDPVLSAVYAAISDLDSRGQPLDAAAVWGRLLEQGKANRLADGEGTLADIMAQVVTVENLGYHARRVRDLAIARRVATTAQQILARATSGEIDDVGSFLDESEALLLAATARRFQASFVPLKPLLKQAMDTFEMRGNRRGELTGVPSTFKDLDLLTAGFQPGDLIIIAARPSMGKTAFAMSCVRRSALRHKIPWLVFSLEMSKESIAERMITEHGRVSSVAARTGSLDVKDWIALTQSASELSDTAINVDDSASPTLVEIRAKARRWRAQNPDERAGIVIDYLQLIAGSSSKEEDRRKEIEKISRGLKALAKELKVPVIALSQLNRGVEARSDKRPMMSDLRESGALEQDADLICFLYREEVYLKEQTPADRIGVCEVIIGKQRNGPTGTPKLSFEGKYTRFDELPENRDRPPERSRVPGEDDWDDDEPGVEPAL